MVLCFEECYRERIEFEYGSIIEFKRQLYRVVPSVENAITSLIEVVKIAAEQLITCMKRFIESWWNVVKDEFVSTFKELEKLLYNTPEVLVRAYRDFTHHDYCRTKCQYDYNKNRLNKPTYCRCRSNC